MSGETKKWFARVEVSPRNIIFEDPFSVSLTGEEKKQLKRDGYIHLREVLKRSDVDKALRCINQVREREEGGGRGEGRGERGGGEGQGRRTVERGEG
jgi:hypothetical protein